MPNRPSRPSGGTSRRGEGSEESQYDWLYGGPKSADARRGAGRASEPPPSDDPEPTRMMPTMSRPQGQGRSAGPSDGGYRGGTSRDDFRRDGFDDRRSTPRPAPVVAPEETDRGRRDRSRSRRGAWRWVKIVLLLWLVFLIAVPVWAWIRVDKVDAAPSGARPADQPGTTYLLVGSDTRKGLSAEERRKLGLGNASGQRTDTIMLLHVGSGPDLLLSIPRDSYVPIPGYGSGKINSAFAYGGPRLLVKTIEQDTGVRVDHYVEIGFGGFVNAVDAVGGVEICPKRRLDDPLANLHVKRGCQNANGATALGWARSRHTQALGDIARAQHQRQIVAKVGAKVKSPWTILNPFRYFRLADAAATSLTVDKDATPFSTAAFAWAMTHVGRTCSMPISDLYVHWDRTRAMQLLQLIKEDRTGDVTRQLCTASGFPPQ